MCKVTNIGNWENFSTACVVYGDTKHSGILLGVQSRLLLLVSSSFSFSLTAVCISRISCSDHSKLSFIFVRHVSNCVFHSSASLLFSKSFYSNTFVFNFCISSNFVINSFFSFSISRLFFLVNVSFILSFILDILILLFVSSSISAIVIIVFFEH